MTSNVLTISAALVLLAGAPAAAQSNGGHGWLDAGPSYSSDDYRAGYAEARRAAYDNGYKDGLKRGEQAARSGKTFNAQVERDYRDGDNGYNRAYGDRARYRDDYRGGFAQGYRVGYEQRAYPNNGQYPNTAPYPQYPDRAYPRSQAPIYPGNGRNGRNNGYGGTAGYGYPGNSGYGYGGSASYGAFQNGASDGYKKGLEDVQDRKSPDATRHKWYRSADHDYDSIYGSKDAYKVEYRRGFQEGYNRAFGGVRRY